LYFNARCESRAIVIYDEKQKMKGERELNRGGQRKRKNEKEQLMGKTILLDTSKI